MTTAKKRLAKIRNNPRAVRPEDLEAAILCLGYVKRAGKGDHRVYTKQGVDPITIDFGRTPVLEVYVRKFIDLLKDKS